MKEITVTGLTVLAKHGVFAEEKQNAQPFIFDIALDCEIYGAAKSDNLSLTVSYAEVCSLVEKVCKDNSFNLIETLAYECAFAIAENFPLVSRAEVTVSKPCAPMPQKFSSVSVTAVLKRENVVLSVGSSMGDREKILNGLIAAIDGVRGVKVKKVSSFIETPPYGGIAKNNFLNCALLAECLISPRALLAEIHKIEASFKRERKTRWDDRTADIDIIFFGGNIIREEGLSVPHPDYLNRSFVIEPLKEIVPDFVCPDTGRRVSDL